MTDERIEALERRVATLEQANSPCKDGHSFCQAQDEFRAVLFCSKCGKTQELGEGRRIGLK